jgi:hypothetical protein
MVLGMSAEIAKKLASRGAKLVLERKFAHETVDELLNLAALSGGHVTVMSDHFDTLTLLKWAHHSSPYLTIIVR